MNKVPIRNTNVTLFTQYHHPQVPVRPLPYHLISSPSYGTAALRIRSFPEIKHQTHQSKAVSNKVASKSENNFTLMLLISRFDK